MNFFKRVFVFMYSLVLAIAGFFVLAYGIKEFYDLQRLDTMFASLVSDPRIQITLMVIGAIVFISGLIAPGRMERKIKKNRVVSFQNPDGEVSVSLTAIEEYIHKAARSIQGIKDVKSRVTITRRGIDITAAVNISAGMNIPEVTERIQMAVKNKIQNILGVEENINMKIHINRISNVGEMPEVPQEEPEAVPNVPYRE
jgi:uncharacterized alkaline shock family protein YloU